MIDREMEPPRPFSWRLLAFAALTVCSIAVAVGYIALRQARTAQPAASLPPAPVAQSLEILAGRPGVLFSSAAFDSTNGYLALRPLAGSEDRRYRTDLRCERVHFAAGAGVCVTAERGVATTYAVQIFGPDFKVRHTLPLRGVPSRARVSPDGRHAAVTVFVSGDSYAAGSFSTRTTLIETSVGKVIADLEEFAVTRDGRSFKAIDFNYWGVTFARDGNVFFATLRSAGTNYLVEGNVAARTARVLRAGVECPSLSPDNTRIVFKLRVSASTWRLHVLDVASLTDTALRETRSVDDQPEWLDNDTIAYMLPKTAVGGESVDTWALSLGSSDPPRVLIPGAFSPAIVR
jgi:hypothetical protein